VSDFVHPYIGKPLLKDRSAERKILKEVNRGRDYRGPAVITTYYLTAKRKGTVFSGLKDAIGMMLLHGTTESWGGPGKEPASYRKHMSFLREVRFIQVGGRKESAMVKIGTPLSFFDRGDFSLARLLMATQSEPFNAFVDFTARVVDYEFPDKFKRGLIGQVWPHRYVRKYLMMDEEEPMIGTIVKPKWLTAPPFAASFTL